MSVLTAGGWGIATQSERSISAAGLACLIKGQVPREHDARPVDGSPEMTPNCDAMISKAKATAREPIRTPRHSCGGVSVWHNKDELPQHLSKGDHS